MDAKNFLRNKSIFNESYVYNIDDESFELSQLLTEYAESLQLIQPVVIESGCKIHNDKQGCTMFRFNPDNSCKTCMHKQPVL